MPSYGASLLRVSLRVLLLLLLNKVSKLVQ
jgi:hypothetical protein